MLLNCEQAANHIAAGELVAYPTEAIYGLGCDPRNESAIEQLIGLKDREQDKGLIVVASEWKQLDKLIATPSPEQRARAQESWPGPVTWIMSAHSSCSTLLTGGRPTIAVRISAHPVVRKLCEHCNSAVVSTSANISGQPPLESPEAIAEAFSGKIAGVVQGELGGLKHATSIFDAATGSQLR